MYIAIDTGENESIVFHFFSKGVWADFSYPYESEDALLLGLTKLLDTQSAQLSKVAGLAVRVGKGRFTATRVAITMANTLAYALQLPVVAYADESLDEVLTLLKKAPPGQYAHATYSAPASIGKK